jgi:hypothetical protein
VSAGLYWKSEESDEEEEAAALRRICGKGEEVRKEGSAPLEEFADNGEDVITQNTEHIIGDTFLESKGGNFKREPQKPVEEWLVGLATGSNIPRL